MLFPKEMKMHGRVNHRGHRAKNNEEAKTCLKPFAKGFLFCLTNAAFIIFDSGNSVKPKKQLETCRAVAHPLLVIPTGSKLKISLPSALNNIRDKSWDSASKTWRLTQLSVARVSKRCPRASWPADSTRT